MKLKMPSPQNLQPVLKKKVDELFLNWLSEPGTQEILKDYLRRVKNGEWIDSILSDGRDRKLSACSENASSPKNLTERAPSSPGGPSSPSSTALPSGVGGNTRAASGGRAQHRSLSTKKVRSGIYYVM